jgi:nucleotide-binding universal stress UspA family protein
MVAIVESSCREIAGRKDYCAHGFSSRNGGFSVMVSQMKAYRRAAVASTFSPTHLAVLTEADAFVRAVGSRLDVLHAAERTDEKQKRFDESFAALKNTPKVHWIPGDNPGDSLLQAAKTNSHDLLIAGALEREPGEDARAFTGSVARRLLGESPCDILLLPRPMEGSPTIENAFFAVEPGQDIAPFVLEAAQTLGLQKVTLAVAETPFAAAIASSRGETPIDARRWAEEITESIEKSGVAVEALHIGSNTGFGLCDAVQGFGADLMIIRATRAHGRIILPTHLDWLRQVIPTRLLVCCGE